MDQQDGSESEKVTTVSDASPTRVIRTTQRTNPPVQTDPPQKTFQKKKAIFRTYQVVWYILGVVEILLVFRITLKALGANPLSGFASLIYAISDPFALPFNGIFGVTVAPQGSVFEWSTLVAALVYAIVAWGLVELMQLIKPVSKEEVEQTVDNK